MKVSILPLFLALPLAAQSGSQETIKFPGTALKWVRLAEPEFRKKNVDLDKCVIFLNEEPDVMNVSVKNPNDPPGMRGGKSPCNLAVEISKKEMKVVRSYYSR